MIVERALPFDHELSCTIIDYHQLSFAVNLFKLCIIVNDSFSSLTMRMIVDDSLGRFNYHRLLPFDQGFTFLMLHFSAVHGCFIFYDDGKIRSFLQRIIFLFHNCEYQSQGTYPQTRKRDIGKRGKKSV